MIEYLKNNLVQGFLVSPLKVPAKSWSLVPVFIVISAIIGFSTNLLIFKPLLTNFSLALPFIVFIFPSLLEEAFFRGILIPVKTKRQNRKKKFLFMLLSTFAFVAWHPFNALTFNSSAIPIFLDPWFLLIVAALGITCSYSYMV